MENENPMKTVWVRAEKGSNISIIYYDKDGNKLIRYKDPTPQSLRGSKSWRHNNPGNLKNGPHAKSYGAIGSAEYTNPEGKKVHFAIFPDYETGRNAFAKLLIREDYIDFTLNEFPRKYTGVKKESPDTKEAIDYRTSLQKMTKFDMDRTIRSLSPEEYEKLLDAMQRYEGWHPGDEEFIEVKKIVGVRLNKKRVFSEFLIKDSISSVWTSKVDAIILAEDKRLHAVVVHTKNEKHLRPEYHQTPFKQLIS